MAAFPGQAIPGQAIPGDSSSGAAPAYPGLALPGQTAPGDAGSSTPSTPAVTGTSPVGVGSSSAALLILTASGSAPVSIESSSAAATVGAAVVTGTSPVGVGSSSRSFLTNAGETALLLGAGTVTIDALRTVTVVRMGPVELTGAGGPIHVAAIRPVKPMAPMSLRAGATVTARPAAALATDPRTLREQWRYVVVELDGTPVGELTEIEHSPVEDAVVDPATMDFTIPVDSLEHGLIRPVSRQCQVWRGNQLLLRGPILPGNPSDDGATITYRVHDPSWFWRAGRRRIGRVPNRNLLRNGDFTRGLAGWRRGYDVDSIPKARPNVHVVSEEILHYEDAVPIQAAQITGVESVTQSELSSNAVFFPNSAKFRPGGESAVDDVAKAMPETDGLKVSIVGHTANDGTGDGLGLSLRRANAAKARIAKLRPKAVISAKGVGYYDPNPKFPKNSQEQRRVVISYDQTISGKSKQFIKQLVEVTHPKAARYELELAAAAWVKIDDDWSVADANMMTVRIVARRKGWTTIHDEGSSSISDTDPVGRWLKQGASVRIPPDGRTYTVEVYLYAPAALASYTRVRLEPQEQLYFWGADQAGIVRGVVEHMQDPAMGKQWSIEVGTRTPNTGVKRDRIYPHSGRQAVEEVLAEFQGLFAGMDIDVPPHPTKTTVTTYYPRQGQVTDYVLALGSNVARAVPAATRDVGSLVIAQAQDGGSVRDEGYAIDSRAL
ncbi:OmpA family protein, partial [Terrabacter terrigena]